MLARSVRLAQLLELVAWIAVGTAFHRVFAAPAWTVALVPLVGALTVRLGLVCVTFALGWWYRAPRALDERIGALSTVAMVAAEWRAFVAFNLLYLPWERYWRGPPPRMMGEGAPVLLVHGYFANRGFFIPLARRLEAHGVPVASVPNFRSWFATIEAFADELHAAIEALMAATGCRRVALVAHSMGGLAVRAYLAQHGHARVAALVTIGTPHHGTALARFGVGANARQMQRGSAFLATLEMAEARQTPSFPALSLYSPHDNMVAPQDTSRLPWATNVALPGHGHMALGACEETARRVAEHLRGA